MVGKLRNQVGNKSITKRLVGAVIVLLIVFYLNRAYAHFFDYLGNHEIVSATNGDTNPYFYLPLGSTQVQTPVKYFALGDSLTRGVGTIYNTEAYPYLVADYLAKNKKLEYINLAVPGSTTADLINNQLPKIIKIDPAYVSVMIGINDVLTVESSDEFRSHYTYILDCLTHQKMGRVIVINIPYLSSSKIILPPYNFLIDWRTQQFNRIIETLVQQRQQGGANIIYIDLYQKSKSEFSSDFSLYSDDKFHPSAKGYKLWSNIINEQILF